jgi:hypothetical protein
MVNTPFYDWLLCNPATDSVNSPKDSMLTWVPIPIVPMEPRTKLATDIAKAIALRAVWIM